MLQFIKADSLALMDFCFIDAYLPKICKAVPVKISSLEILILPFMSSSTKCALKWSLENFL